MIAILDIDTGNLRSLINAISLFTTNFEVINPNQLSDKNTHLIIPGVGNYKKVMSNLRDKDYDKKIKEFSNKNKPILGICVGMQILASFGYEDEKTEGLNLIDGTVEIIESDENYHLPHVGWNSALFKKNHPVLKNIDLEKIIDYYFVHSYAFIPSRNENILSVTRYKNEFCSMVCQKNILGVQFHPEKSQKNGLKILKNFIEWDGLC